MKYDFKSKIAAGKEKAEKVSSDVNEIKSCLSAFGADILDVFKIDGKVILQDNSSVYGIDKITLQLNGESAEYDSLKIKFTQDNNTTAKLLLQYKASENGYPCKISFNSNVVYCEKLEDLIHTLGEIASSPQLYFTLHDK